MFNAATRGPFAGDSFRAMSLKMKAVTNLGKETDSMLQRALYHRRVPQHETRALHEEDTFYKYTVIVLPIKRQTEQHESSHSSQTGNEWRNINPIMKQRRHQPHEDKHGPRGFNIQMEICHWIVSVPQRLSQKFEKDVLELGITDRIDPVS